MSTTDRLRCPTCGLPTIPDDGHNTPDMATCNQCYEREEGERFTTPDHRQATHTPGPWELRGSERLDECTNIYQIIARDEVGEWELCRVNHCMGSESSANATLIAAAPELKNLLFHALHYIETPGDFTETERLELCQDIDDLIAKAEGRTA